MIYNSDESKRKFSKIKIYNVLLVLINMKLNNKEKIIIRNVKEKVNIEVKNTFQEIDVDKFDKLYSDIEYPNCFNYVSVLCVIKDYFREYALTIDRLYIVKNIFKNLEAIVVSSGPTYKEIDIDKLKKKENDYVIIGVKYVTDYLINNGVKVDCYFCSDYCYDNENYLETVTLSCYL